MIEVVVDSIRANPLTPHRLVVLKERAGRRHLVLAFGTLEAKVIVIGLQGIEIEEEVLRESRWDARVDPADVGVTTDDDLVALAGTVGSYAGRMAALEAAHGMRGMQDVANELDVRVADILQRTDTEIAHAVRRALEWDAFVPDQRIQSSVSNGWVTLEGTVEKSTQREDVEQPHT